MTVAEPAPSAKKSSKRRTIITTIIGLVVMIFVFALLLPQVSSYEEAVSELGQISALWIAALIAAGLLNIFLYPLTVLVAVKGLGYWKGFVQRQSGFLVSNAIPGGGAIAVGTQYAILAHYRVRATLAAAAVSADSVFTYLITLGMPALAIGLLALEGKNASGLFTTVAIIGAIVVVVSVVVIMIVLRSDDGARRTGQLGERLVGPLMHRFHKPTPDLQGALIAFRGDAHDLLKRRWLALSITNTVAQTTPLLVLFCALAGLGAFPGDLSAIDIFAAYSIAIVLTSFPITPGGLGTVDAALVALLTSFGASGSTAVAADLIWRLVWFLPQILAGALALIWYLLARQRRRKHGPSTSEEPEQPPEGSA